MNYYVYIVLLIGSLVSCSESSRHFPRYEDFPDEKALNAQVIHLDTALFRYPFRVAVKDGIAIIMDLHNVDYFFHAFSYPEWEYMTSVNIDKSGQTEKGNGFTPLIRSQPKIIMKTSLAPHWRKRGEASSTIIPKKASWSWQPN